MDYSKMKLRHQLLQFVKLGEMEAYSILGVGSEDIAIEYSAQSNTYKWVTQKNGKVITTGYEMTSGVEQYVHADDPLFSAIDKLRRSLAVGSKASGSILTVALYLQDEEEPATASADEQGISIEFNTFGGSSDNPLSIGYTLNYSGDPKEGIATLDYVAKTATFAPKTFGG